MQILGIFYYNYNRHLFNGNTVKRYDFVLSFLMLVAGIMMCSLKSSCLTL